MTTIYSLDENGYLIGSGSSPTLIEGGTTTEVPMPSGMYKPRFTNDAWVDEYAPTGDELTTAKQQLVAEVKAHCDRLHNVVVPDSIERRERFLLNKTMIERYDASHANATENAAMQAQADASGVALANWIAYVKTLVGQYQQLSGALEATCIAAKIQIPAATDYVSAAAIRDALKAGISAAVGQ